MISTCQNNNNNNESIRRVKSHIQSIRSVTSFSINYNMTSASHCQAYVTTYDKLLIFVAEVAPSPLSLTRPTYAQLDLGQDIWKAMEGCKHNHLAVLSSGGDAASGLPWNINNTSGSSEFMLTALVRS
ncbi:hypothetical protein ACF0H5_024190 [Mactra antiquata]